MNQALITSGYAPGDLIVTMGLWYGDMEITASDIPLIDKADGFEKVRDRIVTILAAETVLQQAKAVDIGKDPNLWKFRVYSERANPWENLFGDDTTPVVNVWYDSSRYNPSSSNVSTRQMATSRYNIDAYCYAEAYATESGHASGDELSARLAHNTGKMLRNILMHDVYKYLLYQGIVGKRWIASMEILQVPQGQSAAMNVVCCRISLDVDHLEEIELKDPETLDIVNIKMRHEVDGQIIAEIQYDYES